VFSRGENTYALVADASYSSIDEHSVSLACSAMATRFEMVLHGDDAVNWRRREEAIAEIQRLEVTQPLSTFEWKFATVNARPIEGPCGVSPPVFQLRSTLATAPGNFGVFDITIAPLVRCWGSWAARDVCPLLMS